MKLSKDNKENKDLKKWGANLNEVPGLEADLKKLMLETGSTTHAELLSKLSFAHRNIDTVDKLWKLTIKPDIECSKKEMIAKRVIIKLYHLSGVSTREISELILDEIDKQDDKIIDKVQNIKPSDEDSNKLKRSKRRNIQNMGSAYNFNNSEMI